MRIHYAQTFLLSLFVLLTLCLCGCAFGRNEATGEITGPFALGRLAETTQNAISAVGDYFLPGLGGTIGLLGTAGIGWARSHARAKSLEGANTGFDEGVARAGTSVTPLSPLPDLSASTTVRQETTRIETNS